MNQVLKTNKAKIVGESVAVLIGRILSTNKSKRPAILVKNFSLEELAEIPPHLVEVHLPGRASPVQVIVAAPNQEAGHFDNLESPQRCLNGDESLIAARNRLSVDGTVFLVLGVNPAELKSMKDFLMVGDDTLLNAHEVLLECAWKVNCRGPLPGVLISNIYAVYKAYLETDQLALRRWVDFLDQLTRNLYEEGGPWTENIVQNEISTTLTKLRLFPDASLFSNNPAKRLRLNFRIANKQNPLSGAYLDDDDWEEKITTTQFVGGRHIYFTRYITTHSLIFDCLILSEDKHIIFNFRGISSRTNCTNY